MINGGYYLKAKCIQNSNIAIAPPHVREIWDWLIKEANFEDDKICLRGQCLKTYKDIIDGLSWIIGWRKMKYTSSQCENAMKYLTKHNMIATRKTARGLLITVLNYDKYQNHKNYKTNTSATQRATGEPQESHIYIYKRNKEVKNNIYGDKFLLKWNEVFGTKYTSTVQIDKPLTEWLKSYSIDDICKAIENIKYDSYWKDKDIDPLWLLRFRDKTGDVDRIGKLLNVKKIQENIRL